MRTAAKNSTIHHDANKKRIYKNWNCYTIKAGSQLYKNCNRNRISHYTRMQAGAEMEIKIKGATKDARQHCII